MNNWVVVEFNQASRLGESIQGPYWDRDEAESMAGLMRDDTAKVGRGETYRVGVIEYPEDEE